jgi:hypothetical protein
MSIQAITDSTWRITLAVMVTLVLLAGGALVTVNPASADKAEDPCSKPVAERVGGWVCPSP